MTESIPALQKTVPVLQIPFPGLSHDSVQLFMPLHDCHWFPTVVHNTESIWLLWNSLREEMFFNSWRILFLCAQSQSHVWHDSVTAWTVVRQASLSMEFSRQEHWSGLPFPTPGHLPDPGVEPVSLASPALAGRFFTTKPPRKP